MKPTLDRKAFEIGSYDTNKIFDSNYARIAPFITATAKRDLYNDFGGYGTHIKRIHTDGVMCTVSITTLIMGTDIGMYKQDKDGVFTLENINRVLKGASYPFDSDLTRTRIFNSCSRSQGNPRLVIIILFSSASSSKSCFISISF
jgi:hypothetical protein